MYYAIWKQNNKNVFLYYPKAELIPPSSVVSPTALCVPLTQQELILFKLQLATMFISHFPEMEC